ncbi:MAG TPA: OsmC family protein [Chitinophagales bacterium]|nr:OsmC family protein [Chitinophagales bacterium]
MEHKKLFFETSIVWREKTTGVMVTPGADEPIEVATPIEFPDGAEGKWSPETLFLGAISSCYMTTFLSFAKRKNLAFINFRCHAAGVVEVIDGKLEFALVEVFPEVHLMEEEQKSIAEEILKRTEKYCLIGNSVKSKILYHHLITAEQESAMA